MISVVISVYNEAESLHIFYEHLIQIIKILDEPYEIIFIDDGSTDGSFELLKQIAQKDRHVRFFSFRKNQGKAEALTLGFQKARGERIVTLDADLQDKPQEIPRLLEKVEEGWDVVCGWRKNRKDSFSKVISSKIFNKIASFFWQLQLHDYNCGLKAYAKDAAKSLHLYGGMHRFIPLLAFQNGFRVCEIPVVHQKRRYGKSKYGFSKIFKDIPDIFTMLFLVRYSSRPLHFFGMIGGILLFIGFSILGYLSIIWFQGESIGRRPLLFLGMLLVLGGFQVFFTGFLADLMISLFNKGKQEFPLKYSNGE